MKCPVAQPGLEAWVEDRKTKVRLNEYQVVHRPANPGQGREAYTECFLETIENPFAIRVSRKHKDQADIDWRIRCLVDGQRLSGSHWTWPAVDKTFAEVIEQLDGKLYRSPLKFAPLPITGEDDEVTIDSDAPKKFGQITVSLTRGKWRTENRRGHTYVTNLQSGTAHEKVKKLPYSIVSVAAERKEVQAHAGTSTSVFTPKKGEGVFYTFVFNYRPRVVLSIMGLVGDEQPAPPPCAQLTRPVGNTETEPSRRGKRVRPSSSTIGPDAPRAEEEDRKPQLDLERANKRVRELEYQVRRLSRGGPNVKAEVVDLTIDED